MLKFKTMEELQNCEELQSMGRYEHQEVELNGKAVIACTTDQSYEDIIWGGAEEIIEDLNKEFGKNIDPTEIATEVRDFILEMLENEYNVCFVDVFDEY